MSGHLRLINCTQCADAGSAGILAGEVLEWQNTVRHAGAPSSIVRAFSAFLALALTFLAGCTSLRHGQPLSQAPGETVPMKVPFKIGNAIVTAEVFQRGKPWPTMINVHDDENTSVAAGKIIIEQSGGRLIELSHGGRRQ